MRVFITLLESTRLHMVGLGLIPGVRRRQTRLATERLESILDRNSDAMSPGARCCAGRPCLEGSESRNRLSGDTHMAGSFFCLIS